MDQSGKVANPAHGQLDMERIFPGSCSRLRIRSRETGSAVSSVVSPLILHTQVYVVLSHFKDSSRFPRSRPSRHRQPPSSRSSPDVSGHLIAYRWRLLPRVRQHTSSPQGSSSYGYCLFGYSHGPNYVRLSLPTPTSLLIQPEC